MGPPFPALEGRVLTTGPPGKSLLYGVCVCVCVCGHAARHVELPWPEIEPMPPEVEARSLNLWTAGEVQNKHF